MNASAVQVQAAYKCACILRDLINPYLLRRMKMDVAADAMPQKNEQVIFCRLTTLQRRIYEDFIESSDLQAIFDGKRKVFHGIDILRKVISVLLLLLIDCQICNHPDLLLKAPQPTGKSFGDYKKSGKLAVVRSLLENWKAEGHRVLLFSQTRQMQDIIERMVSGMGLEYRRMDGNTPVKDRIPMVDEFNANSGIFIFLLTTKVGGLGINLTGADRVIIFDPDWNPSTDMQARERAWRLGQKRDVTIYRLMTSGTIVSVLYSL